ncbi:hypothetical protein BX666DRAFT_1947489 [Dichotomocladium elegans]|nr:hypothetical protein BX666DRAFT_1947489 [Dichotomocladium elegans]
MSNPTEFGVNFIRLPFSPMAHASDDQKNNDSPQKDHPPIFQLFGQSTSSGQIQQLSSSSLSSFQTNPLPTSPVSERHVYSSSALDIGAPVFVPKSTVTAPSYTAHHDFNPFNAEISSHLDDPTDDNDIAELSDHLLSARLLDDFDNNDNNIHNHRSPPAQHRSITATSTLSTTSSTAPDSKTLDITATGSNPIVWRSSLSSGGSDHNTSTIGWSPLLSTNDVPVAPKAISASTTMKHIWDDTSRSGLSSHSYGEMDEKEFDPTLQYYGGSLIDNETIQDMNRLSLSVTNASLEEKQAENVGEDMSALQMLESIFTDLTEEELTTALEEHGYDMDKAAEALFNRKQPLSSPTVAQQHPAPRPAAASPKKRQVCRHFLAGECYRKDCWFAHDLEVKVCKFWLQGSCLKGDFCEFSHHIDVHEVANKISSSQHPQPVTHVQFDKKEYPDLGGRDSKPNESMNINTNFIHGQPGEQSQLEEEFPALGVAAKMKKSPKPIGKMVINFAEAAKRKAPHKGKANTSKDMKPKRNMDSGLMKRLRQPVNIPWLVSGDPLNQEYLKQREQAIQYGLLRNRFFSRATAYYLQGNGAKAKAYSDQAKYYNRLMQEMHNEASLRIFEKRNQHEAFIDLHGLHVDEALDIVQDRLENLSSSYEGIVYIITGTGHHSGASGFSSKRSKIKPSVEEFLRQQNYRFAETSIVGDNKGGIFAVDIRRSR